MPGETELAQNCSFQPLEFLPTPSQGGDHHYSRKKPQCCDSSSLGPCPTIGQGGNHHCSGVKSGSLRVPATTAGALALPPDSMMTNKEPGINPGSHQSLALAPLIPAIPAYCQCTLGENSPCSLQTQLYPKNQWEQAECIGMLPHKDLPSRLR